MTIHQLRNFFAGGLALALLAGCGGAAQKPEPMPKPDSRPAKSDFQAEIVAGGRVSVSAQGGAERTLAGVFYFDYDEIVVRRADYGELGLHGQTLAANPRFKVRLEGHADARGTREYNLALAERRAKAIGAVLLARGAAASQIEAVSFGEEKPAVAGNDEAAWARNRRVQLIYE